MLQTGPAYVRPARIALNAVTTSSTMIRLLQLADVVASCTLAYVAGEAVHSPLVMPAIRPLFGPTNVGGTAVKLHPDLVYLNLYHWLFGDTVYWRAGSGTPLPASGFPYSTSPSVPRPGYPEQQPSGWC